MQNYQCVVTAIDLSEESAAVVNRANDIATRNQAALHLVHVIEPLSLAYGGDIPMDFSGVQDQLQEQAEKQLEQFGRRYQIAPERLHLMIGRPESQIHQLAEDLLREAQARGEKLEYEKIDIADDDALIEQYGVRIPVLRRLSDNAELGWPFDGHTLQIWLAG